jgi:tetratricopeptide (TPR) repeat protein
LKKAVEYFEQAVDSDPGYGMAYAGLSNAYSVLGYFVPKPALAFAAKARAAGRRAVETDAELAEAHQALAVTQWVDWDWTGSERSFRRALELHPDYYLAHDDYALLLGSLGRHEEAMREVRRGLELEPLSPVVGHHFAWVAIRARRYDEAIDQCRKTLELDSGFPMGHFWLGLACSLTSAFDEAVQELEVAHRTVGSTFATLELARTYAASGRTPDARQLLAEVHETFDRDYAEPYGFAVVYAQLGDTDRAFEWLDRARRDRTGHVAAWVKVDPRLDGIRGDPRMDDLLRSVGL